MKKDAYQKRNLTISKLNELFELYSNFPIAEILGTLMSPIGEDVHPYNWDDNQVYGKLEKLGALLEDDYKLVENE